MADESVSSEPPPVETESVTPQTTQKRERSEAQRVALAAARAKALEVRKQNAVLREKEKAVKTHQKAERVRQVEEAYSAIQNEPVDDAEEEIQEKPKKRTRRVIVKEAESDSEHSDIEVVLPRAKKQPPSPSAEDVHYQRAMAKMFHYGI